MSLLAVGRGQRGPGQLDPGVGERFGGERQGPAPDQAERCPGGLLPVELIEHDLCAEPRGP